MPNWVKCRLTMKNIYNAPLFTENDRGETAFDFNQIIKMPESLNMTSGGSEDKSIMYYLTDKCTLPLRAIPDGNKSLVKKLVSNMFAGESWAQEVFDRALEEMHGKTEKEKNDFCEIGKKYVENYQKYGCTTWYDWCTKNWGTKWNACESVVVSEDVVEFSTAWAAPLPVVRQLSRMFPEKIVTIMWADEDMGSNTGELAYQNGTLAKDADGYSELEVLPDNGSSEAYEIYIELWGESECLQRGLDGRWHHRNCDTCHGCD